MKDRLSLLASMVIFGTIGLVRNHLPLSSACIALVRGAIGTAFLAAVYLIGKRKFDSAGVKRDLPLLALSGAFIGINWILLFEAYRYTTVARATMCYYMAPVFVTLLSRFFFGETLSAKKWACTAVSLAGMGCISGIFGEDAAFSPAGTLLGLGAAVLYCFVILLNKHGIRHVEGIDRTVTQLFFSAAVMLPYVLLVDKPDLSAITGGTLALLLVAGVVHTGVAYALYFSAIGSLPAVSVALMSYIDPLVALLISAFVLREGMSVLCAVGAALILLSSLVAELPERGNSVNC